jgi:ribokinase
VEVTVLGGFGVSKTVALERIPDAGETVSGGIFTQGPGGKGSNQAVQLARLGVSVNMVTAIGQDDFGQVGRQLWLNEHVGDAGVVEIAADTMIAFIWVDATGENRIALAPGALDAATVEDFKNVFPVINTSDLLLVSLELNPEVGFEAIRQARQHGVITVCNPAPATPIPPDILPLIDYLVPNENEARLIGKYLGWPQLDPGELAERFLESGVGNVLITLGSKGVLVRDPSGLTMIPAARASKVVDTTGAGDSFMGGLVAGLVRGDSLLDAAAFATRVAAHSVGFLEVIPSLPYSADLEDEA